ncbi:DeoR/GlpR family DNA-binding transcription regulator [Vallitalea sediminicola]
MFAIQRLDAILDLLKKDKIVQVQALAKIFNVSDVTIRKDLNLLQKKGLIIKTHGGAVLADSTKNMPISDTQFSTLASTNKNEKLAEYVYKFIQPGDTIFLGSGLTCTYLSKYININDNISIITNNIEAIKHLKDRCKTLILVGGEVVFHEKHSFTASNKINEYLSFYNINKGITSCSGIDLDYGISVSTEVSKNIYTSIINKSQSWLLLADSDKFNKVAPYRIGDISKPTKIITNKLLPKYNAVDNILVI